VRRPEIRRTIETDVDSGTCEKWLEIDRDSAIKMAALNGGGLHLTSDRMSSPGKS